MRKGILTSDITSLFEFLQLRKMNSNTYGSIGVKRKRRNWNIDKNRFGAGEIAIII
jgi:hypothetical protein